MFPIPVTVTPIEIAPCSQCCDRIKFNFICARPPRFGRSDNVITDNCVDCVVLSQNGDSGSFIPTMMESADIICDDVLGNYYNGTVNNVITTFACT
uniref:C6 domain-containing protein n=1 Tax=Panagrolaimus davidi TaxID=227884 RepID=A0A914PAX7_9BILA